MEGDLKMDILKGKRYDIMNVLWEEGRPLSAFEINDIAPELKMPTVRSLCKKLYPSSFKRRLFKRKRKKQKNQSSGDDDRTSGIR